MNKTVFSLIFLLAFFSLTGVEPDFYVWQRQHTPEMQSAVKDFYLKCSGKLYFLAGELENDGRIIRISPSKAVDFARAVPVVRIHVKNLEKTPEVLAEEIVKIYAPWKAANALQIDLDAPESRLDYYRTVMLELRKKLPGTELSATVLPCHLKHDRAFRELAGQCDFYVLQVHGLTRRNQIWSIYDHGEAVRAIMLAKSLKLPFKTALPLYCNQIGGQWVKPDFAKVNELAAFCSEVIGFRLGIPGDGSALDLETALQVCKGQGYAPKLETRWEQRTGGAWHLFIRNCGFFAERVTLSLDFKEPPMDMDTFNRARLNGKRNELTLILPPSGMEKPYLWVRTDDSEKPMITLKMRGGNKL
ncbi:MAG: DUF3142 domain-containing protein [Lentisphaeria bacterium]|nr:DUF3142 domain-containing protein [Lentisphaeria bacterium]